VVSAAAKAVGAATVVAGSAVAAIRVPAAEAAGFNTA
jgi:hypothetical protein